MWSSRESDSQGVIPSGLFWRLCTVKGPGFLCRKSPLPVSLPSRPSFAPLFAKRPHEPAGSLRRGRGPRPTHSARRQTRPHAYKPPTVAVAVTKTDTTSRPFPASLTLNPAGSETAPGFPVGWGGVGGPPAVRSDVRGRGRRGRGRAVRTPEAATAWGMGRWLGIARKNLAATTSREAGRGGPYVTPARARAGRRSLGRHFRAPGGRWSARGADWRLRTMTEADGLRQRRPLRPQVVTDDNRTPEAKGGR